MNQMTVKDKPQTAIGEIIMSPACINQAEVALAGTMSGYALCAHLRMAIESDEYECCTDDSKMDVALKCIGFGWLPMADHCALIPRNSKHLPQGVKELTCLGQWQGYKAMMERHPEVLDVTPRLVHASDSYVFNPETQSLDVHSYDPFDGQRIITSEKDIVGGYVVVTFRDGRKKYHFTPVAAIVKARKVAKTNDFWGPWFEQMALKTVIRDSFARRVVSYDPLHEARLREAVRHDDLMLGNDPSRVSTPSLEYHAPAIEHQPTTVTVAPQQAPASRTESLANRASQQRKQQQARKPAQQHPPQDKPPEPFDFGKYPAMLELQGKLVLCETRADVRAICEVYKDKIPAAGKDIARQWAREAMSVLPQIDEEGVGDASDQSE